MGAQELCKKNSVTAHFKKEEPKKEEKKEEMNCRVSKDHRCGKDHNNTICDAGYCSKWGWCGNSDLHKSTQQKEFNANEKCKGHEYKEKPKCNWSKNGRCGPAFDNTICKKGYC